MAGAAVIAVTVDASAVSGMLNCTTARTLSQTRVRPVWFPFPQPAGFMLRVNSIVPSSALGLKWEAGANYFFLARVPGGTNWKGTVIATPALAALGGRTEILRDVSPDGRLWAFWPTSGRYVQRAGDPRSFPADVTYAVAQGFSVERFTNFLRSLRRITWPSCPSGNAIIRRDWGISFVKPSGWRVTTSTSNQLVLVGPETITIEYRSRIARFTDSDAKFGEITFYWSTAKGTWLMDWYDDRGDLHEGDDARPRLVRYLFPDVPLFEGIGRWRTYVVALSHTSFLRFNITGSGQTRPLDDLLKTVRRM